MWCFIAECGETHARASAMHDETGTPPHTPALTITTLISIIINNTTLCVGVDNMITVLYLTPLGG